MKTVGPMFSLGASGTIGGVITMATWKGRPYARVRVTPSNPRSAAQTANRSMMAFLSQTWAGLATPVKEAWAELGQQGSYSPFNAFVKANMNYWSEFLAPTQEPNPARTLDPATLTGCTSTAGVKSATVSANIDVENDNWGAVLFLNADGTTSGLKSEVVAVKKGNGSDPIVFELSGLKTGTTYNASAITFSTDGKFGVLTVNTSFTPT
jgi:hypothetical protein